MPLSLMNAYLHLCLIFVIYTDCIMYTDASKREREKKVSSISKFPKISSDICMQRHLLDIIWVTHRCGGDKRIFKIRFPFFLREKGS